MKTNQFMDRNIPRFHLRCKKSQTHTQWTLCSNF